MISARRFQIRLLTIVFVTALFMALLGCTQSKRKEVRHFALEGKVVAVDKSKNEITLDHREIPGYMPAMTMPYRLQDTWVLNVAQPGDELRGTLVVSANEAHLEDVSVNKSSSTAETSSTSTVHLPEIGEQIPDFVFVDQDGHRVRLSQFRGRPLLLTFIYTRCPLPDFCIRMSNNFGELAKDLKRTDPAVYRRLQLLSISIDPEFDKPPVLKRYGKSWAGDVDPSFEHWKFVSGSPAETRKAANYFGLSYNSESGQIVHSLRTVLIASDGKIAAQYGGNDWTPAQLEAEVIKLAGKS